MDDYALRNEQVALIHIPCSESVRIGSRITLRGLESGEDEGGEEGEGKVGAGDVGAGDAGIEEGADVCNDVSGKEDRKGRAGG